MSSVTAESGEKPIQQDPHYLRLSILGWLHFLNDGAANYLPGVLPAVLVAVEKSAFLVPPGVSAGSGAAR